MLVLAVKEGDYLMFGDEIKVKILEGAGKSIIGIDAPKNIPVLRKSVYERNEGIRPEEEILSVDDL